MADVVPDRRSAVLESALDTFARRGYRATSMEDVAQRARISRPGLYLYFSSKPDLLRAAVEHALARDVARCEALLSDSALPLRERLQRAIDLWSGQYVGPLSTDLDGLLQSDAALLGDMPQRYSARFSAALTEALRPAPGHSDPESVRDLLLTVAVGLKHRAADAQDFSARLHEALEIILR